MDNSQSRYEYIVTEDVAHVPQRSRDVAVYILPSLLLRLHFYTVLYVWHGVRSINFHGVIASLRLLWLLWLEGI